MKKSIISRTIKLAALFLPLILAFLFLQAHVYRYYDHNTNRIFRFYQEEENSLDVVFLGASDVMAGYVPGHAYSQYGYTSYNYCIDSNTGALYISQLKEVLAHQDPQLIVVETYGFYGDANRIHSEERFRIYTENIPMSLNKIETIMDFEYDDKLSSFFPLLKYHGEGYFAINSFNRMKEGREFDKSPSVLKGVMVHTKAHSDAGDENFIKKGTAQLSDIGRGYLIDFLSYCREQKLENVVFVNFPRYLAEAANEDEVHNLLVFAEEVGAIIEEYGFRFIDLQERADEVNIDFKTDFYNPHHLNTFGSRKVTEYLGRMFIDEFGVVPMTQSAENKAMWENTADYTRKYFEWSNQLINSEIVKIADDEFYILKWIDEE